MQPVTGFLLVTVLCFSSIRFAESQMLRREAYATVPQLVTDAGYPIEKHRAKTSDGYILQLHRIPAGRRVPRRSDPRAKGKRAVLLIHGLMGSSSDFIIMGPDRSLGYILADAGYDVWLGNLRGNQHTAHQNLTRNDPAFWNYCFHEHGKYDVPAMIDRVLEITGLTKLLYIGYSMGTTSFFTMVSQNPDYNDKIVAFVALAPAVYMDNIRFLTEFFFKTLNITDSMRARGVLSFNLRPDVVDQVVGNMCKAKDAQQDMCFRWIYSIVGEDYEQNDWNLSPVILARLQPASWRQLEHFGKISMTGIFTKWEDGMYGAVKPYNLSRVNIPVTLLYGKNDQLTVKHQIMRLAKALNSTGVLESVRPGSDWHKFNHLDFVFAKDVGKLLNKPLIRHIDKLYNTYGP